MEFKKAINKYPLVARKSMLDICLTKKNVLYFNDSEKKTISLEDLMEKDWCGCAPDFSKFDYCNSISNSNEKSSSFVIVNNTYEEIPSAKGMSIIYNADNIRNLNFSRLCPTHIIFPKSLKLDYSAFDNLFNSCYSLLDVMNMNIFSGKKDLKNLFNKCVRLNHVDTQFFDECLFASSMFSGCTGLTSIDTTPFTEVVDAYNMFEGCKGLTSIDTSPFTEVVDARGMFRECTGLKSVDLTPFTSVSYAGDMFSGCEGLNNVIMPTFFKVDTNTFNNCKNLVFIEYRGTKKSWYEKCVNLPQGNGTLRSVHVKCTDGMIDILKSED